MSKKLVIIIGAILISLLFFFFLFFKKNSVYNLSNFNSSNIEIENDIPNPFLIAAIIDNHPDARPQFGLSQASMVFDVPVEGYYSFLAFFRLIYRKTLKSDQLEVCVLIFRYCS